jgi:regulation of enolase protein 1 (concanavalin A-like superfamily)
VLKQQIEHALVISGAAKNVLTVVAPQDDVVRIACDGETREAGHALMVIRSRPQLTPTTCILNAQSKLNAQLGLMLLKA